MKYIFRHALHSVQDMLSLGLLSSPELVEGTSYRNQHVCHLMEQQRINHEFQQFSLLLYVSLSALEAAPSASSPSTPFCRLLL
jgi:hypothetical protein